VSVNGGVERATKAEQSWIEARLPSGRTILLRGIGQATEPNDEDAGVVQDVRFRSVDFKALTATLHEIGDLISNAVRPLAPKDAEVEIGLGLSASTGQLLLLFGDASADASINVKLHWEFGAGKGNDKNS
jgi:hypothetical protein